MSVKRNIYNFIIALLLLSLNSCDENILIEYNNPNDPLSDSYPTPLKIIETTENNVLLEWIDNTDGKTEIIVERAESITGNYKEIGKAEAGLKLYNDKFELITNKDYFYRVKYVKNNSVYRISNICRANIKFDLTISLAAGELSEENNVLLKWTNNNSLEKSFIIEQKNLMDNKDFVKIAQVTKDEKSYLVKGLDRLNKYMFRVYAVSDHNKSSYSDTIAVYYGFYSSNKYTYSSTYNSTIVEYSPVNNNFFTTGDNYYKRPFYIFGGAGYSLDLYGEYAKFHPSGNFIAVAPSFITGLESKVTIVNANTGLKEFDIDLKPISIDFNRDGSKMVCCSHNINYFTSFVAMYDFNNRTIIWKNTEYLLKKVKFSPKGDKLIGIQFGYNGSSITDDKILVLNPEDGSLISTINPSGYQIATFAISNDGNYLAITASDLYYYSGGGELQIWDLNTMKKIAGIPGSAGCAEFSRDSKYVAVNTKGCIRFYRLSDFEFAGKLESESKYAVSLSMNYNTEYIVTANEYRPTVAYRLKQKWQFLDE